MNLLPSDGLHGLTSVVAGSPRAASAAFSFLSVSMAPMVAQGQAPAVPTISEGVGT